MSLFDEAKIDCHSHVFDPERIGYGTPFKLVERLFPTAESPVQG